jgi:hypothetical protein
VLLAAPEEGGREEGKVGDEEGGDEEEGQWEGEFVEIVATCDVQVAAERKGIAATYTYPFSSC